MFQCWDLVVVSKEKHPQNGRVGYVIKVKDRGTKDEMVTAKLDANSYAGFTELDLELPAADFKKL